MDDPHGPGGTWLTRAKKNLKDEGVQVLVHPPTVQDRIVWIGEGATRQCVRLLEVQAHGMIYHYLTNALELARLPPIQGVALYSQCWWVENAVATVKRLLGLAYCYGGAENAITMQGWRPGCCMLC